MSYNTVRLIAIPALAIGMVLAASSCARRQDNATRVRQSLNAAGYKDVSVSEDRSNGVVTLGGNVASDADKARADSIAKSLVQNEVVANEIAVVVSGAQGDSKTINSDIDKGIRSNLDAQLVSQHLRSGVEFTVNNGVVTLTGSVNSEQLRTTVQNVAQQVPYVQQVVNEIQVKNQKASSSN